MRIPLPSSEENRQVLGKGSAFFYRSKAANGIERRGEGDFSLPTLRRIAEELRARARGETDRSGVRTIANDTEFERRSGAMIQLFCSFPTHKNSFMACEYLRYLPWVETMIATINSRRGGGNGTSCRTDLGKSYETAE